MFAKDLTAESGESFLYRDFQARNIMLDSDGKPYFIDFQGGRKGPYYYDLASFLWQASAHYSFKLRRRLVYEYYDALKQYTEVPSVRHFVNRLSLFVLFRLLQVLGAYGFRGYFERKKHFLDSIQPAMDNLRELLKMNSGMFPYPYLMDMLRRLTELPQFTQIEKPAMSRADGYKTTDSKVYEAHPQDGPATFSKYDGKGPLVVRVNSFSYRNGIPETAEVMSSIAGVRIIPDDMSLIRSSQGWTNPSFAFWKTTAKSFLSLNMSINWPIIT